VEELTDFEKLIECVSQFATLIREYYKALVESGFSKNEAMLLAVEYQKEVLGMAKPKQKARRLTKRAGDNG